MTEANTAHRPSNPQHPGRLCASHIKGEQGQCHLSKTTADQRSELCSKQPVKGFVTKKGSCSEVIPNVCSEKLIINRLCRFCSRIISVS